MNLTRRGFGVSSAAIATSVALAPEAQASSLIALSLELLVGRSDRVIVGTPVSSESQWMSMGTSRRIVTISRVMQEADWLQDNAREDEVQVLTLGGRVGSVQQKIAGAPALVEGKQTVLFVSPERRLLRQVTGMSQGHYPLERDGTLTVVERSRQLPHLVGSRQGASAPPRKRRAVDVLHGTQIRDARALIRGAR